MNVSYGQVLDKTTKMKINSLAKQFCQYVTMVGTTQGQPGSVSDIKKDEIVKNHVPGIFFNYKEDPRYMITTGGKQGHKTTKKPMSTYFRNLSVQSKEKINTARIYELHYQGICLNYKVVDQKPKVLKDGSKLYTYVTQFDQIYSVVTITTEGRIITKQERDKKYLNVYVLVLPKGEKKVLLGDITRVRRL